MIFHKTRIKRDNYPPIYLDNKQIDNVKFTKFLDIIMDENLNWSNHISYIKKKFSKVLEYIEPGNFSVRILYFTYIMLLFSHTSFTVLRYGEMLLTTTITNYNSPEKNIRAITFSPYLAHAQNLFIQLNTLLFRKIVIHSIAIQMYKYNISIIPDIIIIFYLTNSDIHPIFTNRNKIRSAFSRHKHM